MDIEGGKYRVLGEVLSYADRIVGLAVEFHDIGLLRPVFEHVLETARDRFDIVHVHASNSVPPYRDGFPEACEITLARQDLVQGTKRRHNLPLPDLDRPNDPRSPDYRLTFD